jgi:transcriptional regulator with XRE-family HTH domain
MTNSNKRRLMPEQVELPRCAALREAANLSIQQLADQAGVRPTVVSTLERGETCRRPQVKQVLDALIATISESIDADQELVPHRYMPNCETLRQKLHWKRNLLATRSGVERSVIDALEKRKSVPLEQAIFVFRTLEVAFRDQLRMGLSESELCVGPDEKPVPGPYREPFASTPNEPGGSTHAGEEEHFPEETDEEGRSDRVAGIDPDQDPMPIPPLANELQPPSAVVVAESGETPTTDASIEPVHGPETVAPPPQEGEKREDAGSPEVFAEPDEGVELEPNPGPSVENR